MVKELSFTNNSYSGADMVCSCIIRSSDRETRGSITFGSLQTLSYSVHQDKRPVRSIGNINPKSYTMGQRTIAGSLVFTVFNKHIIYEFLDSLSDSQANMLMDELPPFDIVVSMANEYGYVSKLTIYDVSIINEGQVMSINDIFVENTYQYVARDIDYLKDYTLPKELPVKSPVYNTNKKELKPFFDISNYVSLKDLGFKTNLDVLVGNKIPNCNRSEIIFTISDIIDKSKIVIYDDDGNSTELYINKDSKKYSTELPPGKYKAFVVSFEGATISNDVKFDVKNIISNSKKGYEPIIYRNNNNLYVIADENIYTSCIAKNEYNTVENKIVNRKSSFNDMSALKTTIKCINNTDESLSKTFINSKSDMIYDIKTYIHNNANKLFYSDIDKYDRIIDLLDKEKILDSILSFKNEKDFCYLEVLLAFLDLINDENSRINNASIELVTNNYFKIMNGKIMLDDSVNKIDLYENINGNYVYMGTACNDDFHFDNNNKYFVNRLNKNGLYKICIYYDDCKSSVVDYYVLSEQESIFFYNNVDIPYNDEDNLTSYIPEICFDRDNLNIISDNSFYTTESGLNYNIVNLDNINKKRFTRKISCDDTFSLSNLHSNKEYCIYIEDSNFMKISKSCLFSKNDIESINDRNDNFKEEFISYILQGISQKHVANYVEGFSINNVNRNNIYDVFIRYIYENKNIKDQYEKLINLAFMFLLDKEYSTNNSIINIEANDCKVIFNLTNDKHEAQIYRINADGVSLITKECIKVFALDLDEDDFYVVSFCKSHNKRIRSKFIVINNIAKTITPNGVDVELI